MVEELIGVPESVCMTSVRAWTTEVKVSRPSERSVKQQDHAEVKCCNSKSSGLLLVKVYNACLSKTWTCQE